MAKEIKPYVVGIDIGGTNTVFGIVDARGNVLASSSIKTQRHQQLIQFHSFKNHLERLIKPLLLLLIVPLMLFRNLQWALV